MADETVTILAVLQDAISPSLKGITKEFRNLSKGIVTLGRQFNTLGTRITGVATALLGVASARESIALAERQFQAEVKLLNALGDRVGILEEIKKVSSELQGLTTIGDEALIETAALLVNMRVEAEKIPAALQAVVDTSAALSIPVESIAKAIGLFQAGRAGELGERIPELVALAAQGRLAGEGIDFLAQRFEGAAAAIASTDFGAVDQILNTIGDDAERVGAVFVELQRGFLDAIQPIITTLADFVDSQGFKDFIDFLVQLAPLLTGIAAATAAVSFVLTPIITLLVAGTFLAPTIAALATVAFSLTKISAALAVILFALKQVNDVIALITGQDFFQDFLDAFGILEEDVSSFFIQVFSDIRTGKLEVKDLIDFIIKQIKIIALQVDNLFLSATQSTRNFFSRIQGLSDVVVGGVGAIFASVTVPDAENSAIFQALKETTLAGLDDLFGSSEKLNEDSNQRRLKNDAEIAKLSLEVSTDLADARIRNTEAIAQAEEDLFEQSVTQNEQLFAQIASLNRARSALVELTPEDLVGSLSVARARELLEGTIGPVRDAARDLVAQDIVDQIAKLSLADGGDLSKLGDLLTLQTEVQTDQFEDQLKLQDELLRVSEERLKNLQFAQDILDVEAQVGEDNIEVQKQLAEVSREVSVETERQIRLTKEQQLTVIKLVTSQRELVEFQQSLAASAETQAQAALTTFEAQLRVIDEAVRSGQILRSEALEQEQAALDRFNEVIARTRVVVTSLLTNASEEVAEGLQLVLDQLDAISDKVTELSNQDSTFLGGFFTEIKRLKNEFEDLAAFGAEVANTVVTGLANGLVDVFVRGTKSLRDFIQEFALGIADMIARLIAFNAIATALGLLNPAGAGVTILSRTAAFASGGPVPGTGRGDTVSAMLEPQEYVVRRSAVNHYGTGILEALNRRLIPKSMFGNIKSAAGINMKRMFQTGGSVQGGNGGSNGGPSPAFIVANDQELDRLLAGGSGAFIKHVKSALRDLGVQGQGV